MLTEEICGAEGYDGLLLPGGCDIHPRRYGQEIAGSEEIDEGLDEVQFTILDAFVKAKKPVLGICRGISLLIRILAELCSRILILPGVMPGIRGQTGIRYIVPGRRKVHGSMSFTAANLPPTAPITRLWMFRERGSMWYSAQQKTASWKHYTMTAFRVWSVQWHPERMCFSHKREDTVDGSRVLRFFVEKCF